MFDGEGKTIGSVVLKTLLCMHMLGNKTCGASMKIYVGMLLGYAFLSQIGVKMLRCHCVCSVICRVRNYALQQGKSVDCQT